MNGKGERRGLRAGRRRGLRARRGVTLIELIVASTILMMGLLSIVGVSASISRSLGESRKESLAAMAAQSRFEELAGTSCETLSKGTVYTESSRGVTEKYSVRDTTNNTLFLTDTVSWLTRRTTRRVVFHSLIPCRSGG